MIKIDSFAGGQVFRTALGLSALLKQDAKIVNIRAKKENPGLSNQHLACLKLLQKASQASVFGANVGSKKVVFRPKDFTGGGFNVSVGTAGSACLVLQSFLLPSMLKPVRARILGGTDVPMAPPANFFLHELLPVLRQMHAGFSLEIQNRGYYPKGNGCLVFSSKQAKKLSSITLLQRKEIKAVKIFCHSSGLPLEVSKTMASTTKKLLVEKGLESEVFFDVNESKSSIGCGMEIFGESSNNVISASALGKKGLPSQQVAKACVEKFIEEVDSNACVDVHLSDQLVPFMALAKGKSEFSCRLVSHHLQKSIEVTEAFLPVKFEIKEKNSRFFVSVQGTGFFS